MNAWSGLDLTGALLFNMDVELTVLYYAWGYIPDAVAQFIGIVITYGR